MYDLLNPVNLIQWIFNFAKGIIDFMNMPITIPGVGSAPIYYLFIGFLAPLLLYVLAKRLIL